MIYAVLYLQPRCHPYTVYKLNSFLYKYLHVLLPLEVIWSWIKSDSRITTTITTTTTATPISTLTISNPYFIITIVYPCHNLPYLYCYHNPTPTLPLSYPYLYYYYYYYYYCDGSRIFDKTQCRVIIKNDPTLTPTLSAGVIMNTINFG